MRRGRPSSKNRCAATHRCLPCPALDSIQPSAWQTPESLLTRAKTHRPAHRRQTRLAPTLPQKWLGCTGPAAVASSFLPGRVRPRGRRVPCIRHRQKPQANFLARLNHIFQGAGIGQLLRRGQCAQCKGPRGERGGEMWAHHLRQALPAYGEHARCLQEKEPSHERQHPSAQETVEASEHVLVSVDARHLTGLGLTARRGSVACHAHGDAHARDP